MSFPGPWIHSLLNSPTKYSNIMHEQVCSSYTLFINIHEQVIFSTTIQTYSWVSIFITNYSNIFMSKCFSYKLFKHIHEQLFFLQIIQTYSWVSVFPTNYSNTLVNKCFFISLKTNEHSLHNKNKIWMFSTLNKCQFFNFKII